MTITRRTPTDSGNTTYTLTDKTITLPSGAAAGDLVVIVVDIKPSTANDATIDNDFVLVRSATGGTGTQGIDTGPVKVNIFAKILTGSEGTITISSGTNTNAWCHINFCYAKTLSSWGNTIEASAPWTATAQDTNTASPLTASTTPTTKPTAGDVIEACGIMPSDDGTGVPTTATITAAGLSGGTVTPGGGWAQSSTGQDIGMVDSYWTGFSGTASSTIAVSITNPGGANHSGVIATFSVHEQAMDWTVTPPDDSAGLTDGSVVKNHDLVGVADAGLTDTATVEKIIGPTLSDDSAGLTDYIALTVELGQTDDAGVTDPYAFAIGQVQTDDMGLTDADHTEDLTQGPTEVTATLTTEDDTSQAMTRRKDYSVGLAW